MRIHGVRVEGFKGIEVELPWSSAAVLFGSNDSCKSNILEALTSELVPRLNTRFDPLPRHGDDHGSVEPSVSFLLELDGLDVDGHRDQEVFLALTLGEASVLWESGPAPFCGPWVGAPSCEDTLDDLCEDGFSEVGLDEQARWDELRSEYAGLASGDGRAQAVGELVRRLRAVACAAYVRNLEALGEASRSEIERVPTLFDSNWFTHGQDELLWRPPGADPAMASLACFQLAAKPAAFEGFNEVFDIRIVRAAATEESLASLYGRLETLVERLDLKDRAGASALKWPDGFMHRDPWVERVGEGVALRTHIADLCRALSDALNELAPEFVSDSYEIVLVPLRPDEWRSYEGRRLTIRLRPHGLDRDFDLDVASSGIAAWVVWTASEAMRRAEDELAEVAELMHPSKSKSAPWRPGPTASIFEKNSALRRPGLTAYIFDEPEAHLHPLAQEQAACWIAELARAGAYVLLATHAVPFLRLPLEEVEYLRVTRSADWETVVEPITGDVLGAVDESAEALGLPPVALIQLTRAWLVVEGEHDRQVLTAFYGRELRGAGIQILTLRGAGRAKASFLNLDALAGLRIPFFCLLDNTRAVAVRAGRVEKSSMTEEERIAEQLIRLKEDKGRALEVYGLPFPDILCALPIEAIREVAREHGGHPERADSWDDLIQQHERHRHEAQERGHRALALKPFVLETLGLDGWSADQLVAEALQTAGRQAPAASPLSRLVTEIIANVSSEAAATSEPRG